jgi:membrane protease YdiL (CAAX protease family)
MDETSRQANGTVCFASWTLSEAIFLGSIGVLVFTITLAALLFVWRPTYGLARPEARTLDVILECLAVAAAGYVSILAFRKRHVECFWQGIEWNASTIPMIGFCVVGLLGSLVLRALSTRQVLPEHMVGVRGSGLLLVLILLSTFLLQPILEEIYFRGILFAGIASRLDTAKSIFIVTVIFDLVHAQHQLIVLPFAIAVGIVKVSTRSTANCFAMHAAYNLGVIFWGVR